MKRRPKVRKPHKVERAEFDVVEPRASALIESLRAFGYSLRTAIADLVDNSISAGAKNIWLLPAWAGDESFLALVDDGQGMSQKELVSAMRPGSMSPVDERSAGDLGRFGLGLKTASFSQCRRLTVWSKRDGGRPAVRCWDLDYVTTTQQWRLLRKIGDDTKRRLDAISKPDHGTIVLWENLDRLVGEASAEDGDAQEHFHDAIDSVRVHLGMVFHRFLSKEDGLALFVSGSDESHRVEAWDPFLTAHSATQVLPPETIPAGGSKVQVESFILPHHDKLSRKAHKAGGGPAGWNAQQGFYVYRNDRLLVSGSWLALGFTKEEHYKLARIAVDFPSALDHAWHIDVKKSTARPPRRIRKRLKQLADIARKRAVEVYRHRDPMQSHASAGPVTLVWGSTQRGDKTVYHINRDHPLVQSCLAQTDTFAEPLKALLRLIEETVPVHHIWLDSAQNAGAAGAPFENVANQTVLPMLQAAYLALRRSGHSPDEAREKLSKFEGLVRFKSQIQTLVD